MYLFLANLSLADIGFISTMVPNMIVGIQTQSIAISYVGCLTQMSFFLIFRCMDDMLLTVMAYNRFVAICHPLHYPVIMNPRLCGFLVLVSLLLSFLESQLHNLIALYFTYFKDVEIANFFCQPSQILSLICFDTFTKNIDIKIAVFSVMYTVVTPMLNPFIYSLKNKDIKTALMKLHSRPF
uniref:olfactory receptor 7E24-like n=1 Tax=Callospermophilus lateralis TaxID=76772 RepID=UPI004038D705